MILKSRVRSLSVTMCHNDPVISRFLDVEKPEILQVYFVCSNVHLPPMFLYIIINYLDNLEIMGAFGSFDNFTGASDLQRRLSASRSVLLRSRSFLRERTDADGTSNKLATV